MAKVEEKFTKEYLSKLDKEMDWVLLTFDSLFKSIVFRNVDFFKEFLIKVLKLDISSDDLLIDVEINISTYKASKKKNHAYLDKIITLQLEVDKEYKVLRSKKVYQLNFNSSIKESDKVEFRTIFEYDIEHKKITDESKVKVSG